MGNSGACCCQQEDQAGSVPVSSSHQCASVNDETCCHKDDQLENVLVQSEPVVSSPVTSFQVCQNGQGERLQGNCQPSSNVVLRSSTIQKILPLDETGEEQDRLEELTSNFTKKLVEGYSGVYLDQDSKQLQTARFCTDARLKTFFVLEQDTGDVLLKCPFANILEIYACHSGEPSDFFPSALLDSLTSDERKALVLGTFTEDSGDEQRFYLIHHQDKAQSTVGLAQMVDDFVKAMTVLKVYAKKGMEDHYGMEMTSSFTSQESVCDENLEQAAQKKRVMIFGKRAVKGRSCSYIDERKRTIQNGVYQLDKGVQCFSVATVQGKTTKTVVKFLLSQVAAWYTFEEDAAKEPKLFPEDLMKLLSPEDQQCTVLGVYDADNGKRHRLWLVVDEVEEFMFAMRILGSYVRRRSVSKNSVSSQRSISKESISSQSEWSFRSIPSSVWKKK